jgi:hypothetical protein
MSEQESTSTDGEPSLPFIVKGEDMESSAVAFFNSSNSFSFCDWSIVRL